MATRQITIAANVAEVMQALADLPGMLQWSSAQAVEVIEWDPAGRPTRARWRERYGPLLDEFVLQYHWHTQGVSWRLSEGRILKRENGCYQLDAVAGDCTNLTYSLELGIGVPIPKCVRMRIESLIIRTTLDALKKHLAVT
jgi:hypothetical protein